MLPEQYVLGISSFQLLQSYRALHPTKFYCLIAILDTIVFFVADAASWPPPAVIAVLRLLYCSYSLCCTQRSARAACTCRGDPEHYTLTRGQYSTVFVSLPTFIKVVSMLCLWPRDFRYQVPSRFSRIHFRWEEGAWGRGYMQLHRYPIHEGELH